MGKENEKGYEMSFFEKMAMKKVVDLMTKGNVKQVLLSLDETTETGIRTELVSTEMVLLSKSKLETLSKIIRDKEFKILSLQNKLMKPNL